MSKMNVIIGGYFGGTIPSVNWFSKTFYKLHDEKLAQNLFIGGKEQTLLNWIVTQYPERFFVVLSPTDCGNVWFYFQFWYSSLSNVKQTCQSELQHMTDFILFQ